MKNYSTKQYKNDIIESYFKMKKDMNFRQYTYSVITHPWYDRIAFSICLLYALLTIISPSISTQLKNGILIMSLPFIALHFQSFKKMTIFILFLFSILIQMTSWVHSWYVIPDYYKSIPDIKRLTDLFLFIFLAIWIKGKEQRTHWILFTAVTGFIIQACYSGFVHDEFLKGFQGYRVDFGMHNAQYTSMIAAVSILICIYLLNKTKLSLQPCTWIVQVILFTYLVLSGFILVISQSRQVWLGFIIILLLSPLIIVKTYQLNKKSLSFLYLGLAILLGLASQSVIVQKRVMAEDSIITKVAEGNVDHIPMTSVGIRINSWILASNWITDHPVLGASPRAIPLVLRTSKEFNKPELKRFGHLHNYYIETLVAYGILGLTFLFAYYYSISYSIIQSNQKDALVFFASFLIFWIIINNFESYNSKTLGIFIHTIVISSLYSKFITKKIGLK